MLLRHYKSILHRSIVVSKADLFFKVISYIPLVDISLHDSINKNSTEKEITSLFLELQASFPLEHMSLYTDGSKQGENSAAMGASVYIPFLQKSLMYKLPPKTSIFSAEAWAILQAINIARDLKWDNVVIYSDSLSMIKAVAGHTINNKSN